MQDLYFRDENLERLRDVIHLANTGEKPQKAALVRSGKHPLALLREARAQRTMIPEDASIHDLPLVVKFYKPAGMIAYPSTSNKQKRNDLRWVFMKATDQFELDLYQMLDRPVTSNSGLMLWCRDPALQRELRNPKRGVLHEYEVTVKGAHFSQERLREEMRKGVRARSGKSIETNHVLRADLKEVVELPTSTLQDPQFMLRIQMPNFSRQNTRHLVQAFGFRQLSAERTRIGGFLIDDDMQLGELTACTRKEQEWARELMKGVPTTQPEEGYISNRA